MKYIQAYTEIMSCHDVNFIVTDATGGVVTTTYCVSSDNKIDITRQLAILLHWHWGNHNFTSGNEV